MPKYFTKWKVSFWVDISATHVCILTQELCYVLNFKKHKLNFKGHLQRTLNTISNQTLFCRFQSWCWTAIQKMKSKDKAFLEKFRVKESNILISLENFVATVFSTMFGVWVGVVLPPSVKKWPNYTHQIFIPLHKSSTPPYCYLK